MSQCPACRGPLSEPFRTIEPSRTFETVEVEYRACHGCGLVSKDPQPSQDALRAYYEQAWQFSEPRPIRCLRSAAWWLRDHLPGVTAKLSAVDVGAKGVELLDAIDSAGLELSEKATMDAQPVVPGVERVWLGSGYESERVYDLVVATHILEHALDPLQFMADLLGMTSLDGYVYVEVPSLEIGALDISACDDINPNHFWHFTAASLGSLAERAGLSVLAVGSDMQASGWPCLRLLARPKWKPMGDFMALHSEHKAVYWKAREVIAKEAKPGDGYYGATQSLWKIGARPELPIFDLYKHGMEFDGVTVMHPKYMHELCIERVWLTPRFWNSAEECKKYLRANHPKVEILTPYR